MILVLSKCWAVSGNGADQEFSDHTAEAGRHEHRFKTLNAFCVELRVDEAEETKIFIHRLENSVDQTSVGDDCGFVKLVSLHRHRVAG